MAEKRGKTPYKELVKESIRAVHNRFNWRIKSVIEKILKECDMEVLDKFYTSYEKEQIPDFLNDVRVFTQYKYGDISKYYYLPPHNESTSRVVYVVHNELKRSEEICALFALREQVVMDIHKDLDFIGGMDNNKFGEQLFSFYPRIKQVMLKQHLEKFSDKAKSAPPVSEKYQWKLNGVETALTWLELNKE
jgi:hypothetical protein